MTTTRHTGDTAAGKTAATRKTPPRNWRETFLAALGETSNVSAAARKAKVQLSVVYKLRRSDPAFARRWFEALAEGYDNLELELLARLRSGEVETATRGGTKRKFDTATAFRCLAAHRDSVAREKGRRTLADEVATIASINEKIDRLRLNRKETDAAVAKVRKAKRAAAAARSAAAEGASDGAA